MGAPHRRDRVEGEVVVAAARVELEVVLLDAVYRFAEAVDGERRLESIGEDRPVHVRRGIPEPGEAGVGEVDGEDALKRRAAGIEIADGGALEGGRPRIGRAHRGGEVDDLARCRPVERAESGYGH